MVCMCGICNKVFIDSYGLNRHLNSQKTCDPVLKEQRLSEKLTCQYCGKKLSRKDKLKNHSKTCEKGISNADTLKEIIVKLNEKIDKQSDKIDKQMEQLMNKESSIINIGNVNTNITNQTQNVYGLRPFGKENLDFITTKQYNNIFKKGCRAVQHFVELIHCNENVPENRNIYIGNFKDEYIRTFNGKDWDMEGKEDVIYNLFHMKRDLLVHKYHELKDSLTDSAKYYFGEKYFENGTSAEAERLAKEDIKGMLYNNRLHVQKRPPKKQTRKMKAIENKIAEIRENKCEYINDIPLFQQYVNEIEYIDDESENPEYIPSKPMFKTKQ